MKIEIERLNDAFHMEATNERGNKIQLDSSAASGGHDLGFSPMQLMLAGIGGCSTIDIVDIMKKQRENLQDIKVTVTAEREKDKTPALFASIHLHYRLFGDVNKEKAQRAVELSMDKYCSVAKILEKTANITYDFEVIAANAHA
ncbi:OsmC family protein [uncultured Microscilla sp.]|uniref:OsmC family protein n=1 Tax=uncultured Microscilla sp. TaxID=432653 RepID=UPI002634F68D|nr:OsmC family protein [uncultured Microscilla sp.]